MKIRLAEHSGFCFGVRNAILRIVNELNNSDDPIYVYGPLIHNPQTVSILENRGLETIHDLSGIKGKQVAVRTHGISIDDNRYLKNESARCINLTCPRVARVQAIIKKFARLGSHTIILGDKDHAEVIGLKSYATSGVTIVSSLSEIDSIPDSGSYLLVSQTTLDRELFDTIVPVLEKKLGNLTVMDTICDSTKNRQEDVRQAIKDGFDTLIVVGGRNSANTTRLAGIGRENGMKTFHIETEKDLHWKDFINTQAVLVTAGASTPGWIINNVLEKLYNIKFRNGNILAKYFKNFIELLVRTNTISSLFAFAMTCFVQSVFTGTIGYTYPLISLLYIFSMYSFNNYFDRDFLKDSNSYKYAIYDKYGFPLMVLSIIYVVISFYSIRNEGVLNTILLLFAYLFGFSYFTTPVKKIMNSQPFPLARKIYNSKIITGIGWLITTTIIPLTGNSVSWPALVYLSFFIISLITIRHILIDIIAFQGDFIMGRDTIPIWLGIKKSQYITYSLSIITFLAGILYAIQSGYYIILLLNLPFLYYSALIGRLVKIKYLISIRYEFIIDMNFIFSTIIFLVIMALH